MSPRPGWQHPGMRGPALWAPPPPRSSGGAGVVLLIMLLISGAGLVAAAALFGAVSDLASPQPPVTVRPEPRASEDRTSSPDEPSGEPVRPSEPLTLPEDEVGLPTRDWPPLPGPTSTDPDWVALQQSTLYAAPIPTSAGCPPPAAVVSMAELEAAAGAQMDCLQAAWKPTLASLGYSTQDIPVFFFAGDRVETPCGEVSAPALYCSAQGGAVYFGETTLNGAAWHDFGVKDMAGHEYGHHLQSEAGMFLAEASVGGDNGTARRLELQATCFGYAMIAHDPSFTMTRDVYDSFEPYLRAVVEDGIHGSKDSVATWGLRGLYSSSLGNCNTWTALPGDVD